MVNFSDFTEIWGDQQMKVALTGDIDGDNLLEIIALNETTLKAFEGDGTVKWSAPISVNNLDFLVADVTGDGLPEILLGRRSGGTLEVLVFDGQGNLLKTLSRPGGFDSSITPQLATDLDSDGHIEILCYLDAGFSTDPRGYLVFDYTTGVEEWYYDSGPAGGTGAIADLDGNGILDIVRGGGSWHNGASGCGVSGSATCTTDDQIYTIAFRADNGAELFTDAFPPGPTSSHVHGYVKHAVADFANTGNLHALAVEGHESPYSGTNQLHLLDATGAVLKTYVGTVNAGSYSNWAIADLNGDGAQEVVLQFSDSDKLMMFDSDLNVVQETIIGQATLHSYWENLVISDVNGDGWNEILFPDYFSGMLRIFDTNLNEIASFSYPAITGVVLSDLNNDGVNEIIVAGNSIRVLSANPSSPPPPPNHVAMEAVKRVQILLADSVIRYEIVITNIGSLDQPNNSGPEFEDPLPDGTQLFPNSEEATSGNVSFDAATNRILWNGSIPTGGSVTIRFTVLLSNPVEILSSTLPIAASARRASVWPLSLPLIAALLLIGVALPVGKRRRALCALLLVMLTVTLAGCPFALPTMLCNQGLVNFDPTGDGTNDAQQPTDDPSTTALNDATCFTVTAMQQ